MNKRNLEESFLKIIRNNERVIYKVCSFYVSDELLMPDLYQEVVCNLWTAYPRFENKCSVSTWIYRIALNTCISGLRQEKRKPQAIPVSIIDESLLEPENMNEQIKEMYHCIHQLRSMERAIILLYLDEKSYKEIAEITGLTITNVATRLKRSKEKLRQMSNFNGK